MSLSAGQALTWVWRQSRGRVKRKLGLVEFKVVVAVDADGGVGFNNDLPWPRIPEDMKHFRNLTMGQPVVMGRRTKESLPPSGLPGRSIVEVTHKGREGMTDQQVLEEALNEAAYLAKSGVVWVIGGPALWAQCFNLDLVDEVVMTMINGRWPHDQTFPYREMHGGVDEDPLKAWACTSHELLATNEDGTPFANVAIWRRDNGSQSN